MAKDWLGKARGEDGVLMAWTVNTRESAMRATRLGSMFLATDRPRALRNELTPALP